ncbi:MAG: hypothetical protein HRU80_12820 [Ignavibacteriales bacterium]|nr:MAG: hypothetical protein HRU80_12820 [Ignavibacteriales bacterium]
MLELIFLIIISALGMNVFVWYYSSIVNPYGRSYYPPVLWKFSGHVKSWIAILVGILAIITLYYKVMDFNHFGMLFLLSLGIILIRKSIITQFHLPYVPNINELLSRTGYKFGNSYSLQQFLDETKELYAKSPTIREKILGEAYYLIFWVQRAPEIGFLFGIMYYESILIAVLYSALIFMAEFFRFYVNGASSFYAKLCRFWTWMRVPSFVYSIIIMWSHDSSLFIILILFLILQGWLGLYSLTILLPFRMIGIMIVSRKYGPGWATYEIAALQFVIRKWKYKLGIIS